MDWSNLQKDYERLSSFTAVAKEYRVSKSWVSQKVKDQGWNAKDWSGLPALYEGGMTYGELAEHYDCSMSTVGNVLRRMGITPIAGGAESAIRRYSTLEVQVTLCDVAGEQPACKIRLCGSGSLNARPLRRTAVLAGYADQPRWGESQLVLVVGEAGAGKSALLEQFATGLNGALVLGCSHLARWACRRSDRVRRPCRSSPTL
jgi:hypothetical protein